MGARKNKGLEGKPSEGVAHHVEKSYVIDEQYDHGARVVMSEHTERPARIYAEGRWTDAQRGGHHPRDGAVHHINLWKVTEVWELVEHWGDGGSTDIPLGRARTKDSW